MCIAVEQDHDGAVGGVARGDEAAVEDFEDGEDGCALCFTVSLVL